MKRSGAFALVAATLSLGSCTLAYDVEVSGTPKSLFFDVSRKNLLWGSSPAFARTVKVYEGFETCCDSDDLNILWHIETASSDDGTGLTKGESTIQYGIVPYGFSAVIEPTELDYGKVYSVEVDGMGGMGDATFVILPRDPYGNSQIQIATLPD